MTRKWITLLVGLIATCVAAWADLPFRNHRYDSFKVLAPAEGSIVFIGNSITDMNCWPEVFKDAEGNYLPIVNRGNSGGMSPEQSANLEAYLGNKPAKVFMMIGTNDLATNGMNFGPTELLNYISSMVDRIHARYADTEIYLYSILKNNTGNRDLNRVVAINAAIKAYVEETNQPWLTYVDLYDKLAGIYDGGAMSYDKLHCAAAAYKIWAENICQYLGEGVTHVYPENTADIQVNGGMGGSTGMRATYASVMPVSSEDVLFFGDEMVKCGEWQELLGSTNVKNRGNWWGYGGNIAETGKLIDANYAKVAGVTKEDAKAIFLYTGTQDANGNTDIETVKSSYKALVEKIKTNSPTSKLYLMSLCPVTNATTNTNRVSVLNAYMKSIADESADDNVKYVDIYTSLVANGVANSKYFYPANYLGGLGYVKVAQIMKEALDADFPGNDYEVISEAEAETRKTQANLRCTLSQAIAAGLMTTVGEGVGEYNTALMAQFFEEVKTATAMLAKASLTEDEVNAEAAKLNTLVLQALNMPKASTADEAHWYKFYTPQRNNRYMTSNGAGQAVTGNDANNYAKSMWKLVERTDKSFNIVNRKDGTYLNPVANYNAAITTVAAEPAKGWTFSYSNAAGTYIISSGTVQLNQTQAAQNYQVYNWSNGESGQDRDDTGCRYAITEVTEDPAEEPSSEPVVMLQDITLDGTAPYKFTDEEAAKVFALENLTVAIDFTYTEATDNQMLMSSSNSATTELMAIGTTDKTVRTYTPDKDHVYSRGDVTFGTNRHKVVVTMRKGVGYTYYIDGACAQPDNINFAAPVFGSVAGVDGLYLGGAVTSEGSNILPAKATIHSVRVFNYSLTAAEVAALTYGDEEVITEMTYTIDKANGDLYRNGSVDPASWCSVWKSNATPQLQFATTNGVNNMKWYGNNVALAPGNGGSHIFTLTPPAGYVIEEYSFAFVNEGHSNTINLSLSEDNKTYKSSSTAQTVSKTKQSLSSLAITLTGRNYSVKFTDFTVKVKLDAPEKPAISTEGDEHWYYITSAAANKDYCRGKVMYYNTEDQKIHFADKQFNANYIWSFWQNAQGKITIKNYNGQYFGTAPGGTGNNTRVGVVDTPNYIYTINDAFGFFTIKDSGTEFHAQQDGAVIVRWAAEEGGASLWKFDEVDVSEPEAQLSATRVEQGKVTTAISNKDQGIIRSTLTVTGLTGTAELQAVKGSFAGTSANDVAKVKAYIATNSLELNVDADDMTPWRDKNVDQLFGETTLNADGTFAITGTKTLAPGSHYLWIAYDIADNAKEGNTVDATISAYTMNGKDVEEENGNPNFNATIFLSESAVLLPMDLGSRCYRIPAITTTKDGKRLVTLSDDRKNHGADLPSHCYVVAQYSDDQGRSWSRPVTVAGTAETGGDYGHGDAQIITNRINGEIIGIMTSSPYGNGFFGSTVDKPQAWKVIKSKDGGETWSVPVDHTESLYAKNSPNPHIKGGFSGSGAGLQKRDGTLISPFVGRDLDNVNHYFNFISKDGGDTWELYGTSGTTAADEPKVLERNNGDIAISVRAGGFNFHNVSSDNGLTWKNEPQTRFTTGISGNACDGEYMVWCSTKDGNPWNIALQTGPNSGSRQNVSIALSTDEGDTFGTPKTICPRGSAYSAVTVLPDGSLGVYYEENGLSTGGYTMRFVRFSLDWASNGAYKFTEENPFKPIQLDPTVGISDVISAPAQTAGAIYDLSGRRVSKPAAGVYIRNGKKFISK